MKSNRFFGGKGVIFFVLISFLIGLLVFVKNASGAYHGVYISKNSCIEKTCEEQQEETPEAWVSYSDEIESAHLLRDGKSTSCEGITPLIGQFLIVLLVFCAGWLLCTAVFFGKEPALSAFTAFPVGAALLGSLGMIVVLTGIPFNKITTIVLGAVSFLISSLAFLKLKPHIDKDISIKVLITAFFIILLFVCSGSMYYGENSADRILQIAAFVQNGFGGDAVRRMFSWGFTEPFLQYVAWLFGSDSLYSFYPLMFVSTFGIIAVSILRLYPEISRVNVGFIIGFSFFFLLVTDGYAVSYMTLISGGSAAVYALIIVICTLLAGNTGRCVWWLAALSCIPVIAFGKAGILFVLSWLILAVLNRFIKKIWWIAAVTGAALIVAVVCLLSSGAAVAGGQIILERLGTKSAAYWIYFLITALVIAVGKRKDGILGVAGVIIFCMVGFGAGVVLSAGDGQYLENILFKIMQLICPLGMFAAAFGLAGLPQPVLFEKNKPTCMNVFLAVSVFLTVLFFVMNIADRGFSFYSTVMYNYEASDYYTHILRVADRSDLYFETKTPFPPLAYMMYWFLYSINRPHSEMSGSLNIGDESLVIYVAYQMLTMALLIYVISKFIRVKNVWTKLVLPAVLLMSYPLFCTSVQRGNSVLLTTLFLCLAVVFKESESKICNEAALILIAIAAGFKFYPAIMGLLYIKDRDWKKCIRLVIYGVLAVFGPFVFFGGFKAAATLFNRLSGRASMSRGFQTFRGFLRVLTQFFPWSKETFFSKTPTMEMVLLVLCIACAFLARTKWQTLLFLSVAMACYIPSGWMYNSAYFLLPALMFLREDQYTPVFESSARSRLCTYSAISLGIVFSIPRVFCYIPIAEFQHVIKVVYWTIYVLTFVNGVNVVKQLVTERSGGNNR